MRDPLKHYHDREKTWRWGIPERKQGPGCGLVALVLMLSAALGALLIEARKAANGGERPLLRWYAEDVSALPAALDNTAQKEADRG